MSWEKLNEWVRSALKFVTGFVKTAAPAAEVVGAATGNPEVTAAAKLAGTAAEALDKAIDEAEQP
jgi:hypothetical protein